MSTANFKDDERFDGLYLNVAQTTRGIEPLLDSVFSFLRRKTDFLAGPPGATDGPTAAVNKVNEVLQRHVSLYQEEQKRKQSASKKADATTTPSKKTKPTETKSLQNQSKGKDGDDAGEDGEDVVEMNTDGGFDLSSKTGPTRKPVVGPLSSKAAAKSSSESKPQISASGDDGTAEKSAEEMESAPTTAEEVREKQDNGEGNDDDDGPIPVGNGGTVEGKYVWTQTLAELVVTIPVPDNTRGRDLIVTIARTHLKVALKTPSVANKKQVLVDGDLVKPIICDDSFWTVEDGNRLVINLQKQNQMEWWEGVCKGDPIINVRKINPENSSLSDLDGETRKTVEKMMFDQRQKALGLPTSDEQTKLDALENFKKLHPELDFSNAKIS